jgi:hypothetical protein
MTPSTETPLDLDDVSIHGGEREVVSTSLSDWLAAAAKECKAHYSGGGGFPVLITFAPEQISRFADLVLKRAALECDATEAENKIEGADEECIIGRQMGSQICGNRIRALKSGAAQ